MSNIERNVVKLICGDEVGNAVLLNKNRAITVRHCIEPHINKPDVSIKLYCFDGKEYIEQDATLLGYSTDVDGFAVLGIDYKAEIETAIAFAYNAQPFEECVTFGFNHNHNEKPSWRKLTSNSSSDIRPKSLICDMAFIDSSKELSLIGLSGSPILLNIESNSIIGLVSQQSIEKGKEFEISGISVSSQEGFLKCNDIQFSAFDEAGATEKQAETRNDSIDLSNLKTETLLPPVLKEYYSSLWYECSMLKIRDGEDERTQIEKYIYPHFTYNKVKKISPVVFEKGQNNKRIIIAESGLGKSSYLDMLTSVSIYRDICDHIEIDKNNIEKIEELEKCICLQDLIIPVLIRAGNYQYKENIVFDGLLDCIIGGPTVETVNEWINEISQQSDRHIIVMVDAIDEIDHHQRERFLSGLNELVDKLGRIALLVTCRPIDRSFLERSRLFRGIEEWRLEPFDREQMIRFVNAKIRTDTRGISKDADVLLDNIVSNDYLKTLSSNPYMLEKMLVHDYSTVNNTAYSTIRFLVDNLIDKRWDKLFSEFRIESKDFTIMLAGVAYEMVYRQQTIIEKVNLPSEFKKMATEADLADKFPEEIFREIVSKMNNAAGLLIYENEGYKFQYQVFASYLSAEWIYYQVVKNRLIDANVLEDLLPPCLKSELWTDVITILFTVIYESEPRNEFLSTNLFRKVLCTGMGTREIEGKFRVQNIFNNLKQRAFGENNIVSDVTMKTCMEEFSRISKGEK